MKRWQNVRFGVMAFLATATTSMMTLAQEAAPAAPAEGAAAEVAKHGVMYEMIFGCGFMHAICWFALFFSSIAVVAFIIDGILTLKRHKLMPPDVVEGVREALNRGDLDTATATCETNPSPVSRILLVGFANIEEGYEVIQESIASSAEYENEKLMQRVNYLNVCGQLGPMLGLLGTTMGMVKAFSSLGETAGAAKAAMLAVAISTALWTTVMGLAVAIPSLLAYVLLKNYATRMILEMQATVLDLIKVLRSAEVEN